MQLLSKLLHLNKVGGGGGGGNGVRPVTIVLYTPGFLITPETHASFIIQTPPATPLRAWGLLAPDAAAPKPHLHQETVVNFEQRKRNVLVFSLNV